MRRMFIGLLALMILLFTAAGMKNAAALDKRCQSVSLRYSEPLTADIVEKANESLPGLTFWGEKSAILDGGLHQTQSTILYYRGDATLVLGQECLTGELPAPLDANGCAVSTALAWKLFGSKEVIGRTLLLDDKQYAVRGVFESNTVLSVLPVEEAAFTAVELPYTDEAHKDPAAWTDAQLLKSGMPEPDWRLYTAAPAAVVKGLSWLPVLFAAYVLMAAVIRSIAHQMFPARDAICFVALLAVALALPSFLATWPLWLTPSRWSDFSWWQQVAKNIANQFEGFLLAPGIGRDFSVKTGILMQIGISAAQCALCEVMRCYLKDLRQRTDSECVF